MDEQLEGKDAALAILREFMTTLGNTDMNAGDVTNRAFDLALDLAPHVTLVAGHFTPREADIKMRAAMLLREAEKENAVGTSSHQEVIHAVMVHLQGKGLDAHIRPIEGFAPLIEGKKDGHSLQLDTAMLASKSKEDALRLTDTALSGFGEQAE